MVFTYKTLSKIDFDYTKHEVLKKDYIENVSKMGSKCIKATLYRNSSTTLIKEKEG